MATNPYETLGVSRTATQDEIRTAFRKTAKKNHPDLNPGDTAAEDRFKAANAANEILSEPERRAKFDRGEIDAAGQERQAQRPDRQYYRDFAQGSAGARYGASGGAAGLDPDDLGDIFGEYFSSREPGGSRPRKGADRRYRLEVPFLSAINGATERLTLPAGETVDVRIPAGIEDGQALRLRGKGDPGRNGGPDGDALIEIGIGAHKSFRRVGRNVELDLPVTVAEVVLGSRVAVPTPRGEVNLTIAAGSEAGARLRLRGRGVAEAGSTAAGDMFVTLTLVAGPRDEALETALREWQERHPDFDPREALRRSA